MAHRNRKIAKRQRKKRGVRELTVRRKALHPPAIDVAGQLDATLLCCNRFIPGEMSHLIRGFYHDCLAHQVKERLADICQELEYKTGFTRHAQALLQEVVGYMQNFRDNLTFVVTPAIDSLAHLFFTNQTIKSDLFLHSFETVFESTQQDSEKLGSHFLAYVFAVFDMYRSTDSHSASDVALWNSRCAEHILDAGAAGLVLNAAASLVNKGSFGGHSPKDSLRIGWVVAKVFCIYLQDNPSSRHADYLTRFNETSSAIGSKIEDLRDN